MSFIHLCIILLDNTLTTFILYNISVAQYKKTQIQNAKSVKILGVLYPESTQRSLSAHYRLEEIRESHKPDSTLPSTAYLCY